MKNNSYILKKGSISISLRTKATYVFLQILGKLQTDSNNETLT